MHNLFEYGFVPVYDSFQYNNDYRIGQLLNDITRLKAQGKRIGLYYQEFVGKNLRIKQQFVLRFSRILAGAFETEEVHLAYLTFQRNATLEDLHQKTISVVTEIWLSSEREDQSGILSKLLSVRSGERNNIQQFLINNFLPILYRINSSKILIFVFDLQTETNNYFQQYLFELKELLSNYISEKNILFFLLCSENPNLSQINVQAPNQKELLNSSEAFRNKISHDFKISKDAEAAIRENISWLKPLSILAHPADEKMIEFISSYFDSLGEQLKILGEKNIISFLKNSGIAINKPFLDILTTISNQTAIKDEHLIVLGLSGSGLDNKTRLVSLINSFKTTSSHWGVLSSYFQAHGTTALGLGVAGQEKLCNWHIDSVVEALKESEFLRNPFQVRCMMDYTGQILLSAQKQISEANKKHFIKLLEGVADRYSSFLRNQPIVSPEILLEASRYQYKVGHIFDRLFNPLRSFIQNEQRNTSYENAAAILKLPPVESNHFATIAYRKGTAISKLNKQLAFDHYVKCANEIFDYAEKQDDVTFRSYQHTYLSAEELATYAIKTGVEVDFKTLNAKLGNIIKRMLQKTGASISSEDYFGAVINGSPNKFQTINSSEINGGQRIRIYLNRSDLHTALRISEDIFSETFVSPSVHLISINQNIPFEVNEHDDYQIIIGAPDTSDGIGEIVVKYDQMLEQTYHLRMHTDFSEPVLLNNISPKTLILCASGINGILKAWSLCSEKFITEIKNSYTLMEPFLIANLLAPMLKQIGKRATDLLFDKVFKKDKKTINAAIEEFSDKLKEKDSALRKNEVKLIFENLEPSERNTIINTVQQDKSVVIIIESILEKLDIKTSPEDLIFFSEVLWGFAKEIQNSNLTIQQSLELNNFIQGYNIRFDNIVETVTKYRTRGILDKEKLADERSLLYHQTINFKTFLNSLIK